MPITATPHDTIRAHGLAVDFPLSVTALMELHNHATERMRKEHEEQVAALTAKLTAERDENDALRKRESWLYLALAAVVIFAFYLVVRG